MNLDDAFERILAWLYEAALDDARWPAATSLIEEALDASANALGVTEAIEDDPAGISGRATKETKEKEMGARRDMRGAAAASILFLAAGTGAAHATSPFGESFAEGMRLIAAIGNVDVEVTQAGISDTITETLKIKWVLNNVDASIAGLLSGYCARAKVNDESWKEECFSEVPDSEQTQPVVTTRYYMSMTNDDWPESGIHKVTAQVKMEYGTGGWTSWSSEYDSWERF